jgi:hypothetical protein
VTGVREGRSSGLSSALGRLVRLWLPPVERADELAELTLDERLSLYRFTGLTAAEIAAYEMRLSSREAVAA